MMLDLTFEKYFENIFNEIHTTINDYDTLLIAIEVLKIATNRLSGDLENKDINIEYNKLLNIIKELEDIKDNYI